MKLMYTKFVERFISLVLTVLIMNVLNFSFQLTLYGQSKNSQRIYPKGTKFCGGVFHKTVKLPKVTETVSLWKFTIVPTYEVSVTTAERVVLQEAINEWASFLDSCWYAVTNYSIIMRFVSIVDPRVLAQAVTTWEGDDGRLVGAVIEFDNDASTNWYIDPTPGDDSEFQGGNPPAGHDLLSVARHEIGHAIGWTASNRVCNLLSGVILDPSGLNIATAGDTGHTDDVFHTDDLMNTSLGEGHRKSIAPYPDVALVSKAYWYWVPNIRCIDVSYSGEQNGSLFKPWNNAMIGLLSCPTGSTLIAMQGLYPLVLPTTRATRLTIMTPREKNAVIWSIFK